MNFIQISYLNTLRGKKVKKKLDRILFKFGDVVDTWSEVTNPKFELLGPNSSGATIAQT